MTETFIDNTQAKRFEYKIGDFAATAQYRREGSTIYIDRVEAPKELQGTGAAGKLMQNIVAFAQKEKLNIVAVCPYAAAWLAKNKPGQQAKTPRL